MEKNADYMLKGIPMFRDLSDEELDELHRVSAERLYLKKSVVFHEGSSKEAVYFIKEGLVKTYKTDSNGNEQIVSILQQGEMFPHTGFFNPDPYPATAETIVDTTLLVIPVKAFEHLVQETPAMAMKIMRVMSEKIKELQEKIQELAGQDVQDRTISFFIKLAEQYGKEQGDMIVIHLPMTHQDIANVIGTSRESVNRMLNQLRKEGIMETDRQGFVVHDLQALHQRRSSM